MLSNSSVRSANMVPISCSTSPAVRLGFRVGVYSRLFWREASADDDVDIFWREMSAVVVTGVEGDISGLKVTAAGRGGEVGVVVITWVALDGIGLWLFVLGCW